MNVTRYKALVQDALPDLTSPMGEAQYNLWCDLPG